MGTWDPPPSGLLPLPSGPFVRGRSLRGSLPAGALPEFGLYLLGQRPEATPWEGRWVIWRDFRLPRDRSDAQEALQEAWRRAANERVEIACESGRGRTGTALACLAVLDGVAPKDATAYVRRHYDRRAVETPWQHHDVTTFQTGHSTSR